MRYVRFVYDEPAMVTLFGKERCLVVSDLHIGMELKLRKQGIHVDATDRLASRILSLVKEFSADRIVLLGDIKDSILYPDATEARLIRGFFERLGDASVTVVAGNHDAHLRDIVDVRMTKELLLGKFAFTHGSRNPSSDAMMREYLVTAHSHTAVRIVDRNGAIYDEKAWVIAKVNEKEAAHQYPRFNKRIRLIMMPAFNDLITGVAVSDSLKSHNPLFRSKLFDFATLKTYTLDGSLVGRKTT